MARSGNGTAHRQYLYVMGNIPYLWVVKIGITGNPAARLRSVDKSAKGRDFYLFKIKIIWAYHIEQLIHTLCFPFRVRFNGSGKTERFLCIAAVPAVVIGIAVFILQWAAVAFAIFALSQLLSSCQPYRPAIKPLFKMPGCCRERFIRCVRDKYTFEYDRLVSEGQERAVAIDSANVLAIRWTAETQMNMKPGDWRNVCDCKFWEL